MENTIQVIVMPQNAARKPKRGLGFLASAAALLALSPLGAIAYDVEDSIKAIQKEALAKQMEGDIDGAIEIYEKAAIIAKNEFGENSQIVGNLYFDMGVLALDSAKFDRAENYLHRAAQLKDNSVTAHLKLAQLLSLRGTNEKNLQARREIEKALTKNPRSEPARQALAMFYQQQGQPMRAFHQYSYLNSVMNGKPIPHEKFARVKSAPPPPAEKPVAAPMQPVYKMPTAPIGYIKPAISPQPKPVFRPKPKPIIITPKPRPRPKPVARPVEIPVMQALEPKPEPVRRSKPAKGRNGLVPPPPPVMPMFGGGFAPPPAPPGVGSPAFNLKTEAKIKGKSKANPEPAEEKQAPAEKPRATPSGDSPDFLLDWASERKKK